jgi:hypothetical protein
MKRAARILFLFAAYVVCAAHIGSPDAWYRGPAGPYRVLVHVQAPAVIPGLAVVNVRVEDNDVEEVTATVNRSDATGGPPPPEIAEPVRREPGAYRAQLWIMASGSYSITVALSGARGSGSALVPFSATPIRRLGFSPLLGVLLAAAGIVLFAALLSIIGAGVREGVLSPGEDPDGERITSSSRAVLRTGVVMLLILVLGWRWWVAEDAAFERSRYRPLGSVASMGDSGITLRITEPEWVNHYSDSGRRTRTADRGADRSATVMEDHGKIMHMFVVDALNGRGFAHLHPTTTDTVSFSAPLPELPPGQYTVYADLVLQSGFMHSLTTSVDISTAPPSVFAGDPDDSYVSALPATGILSALLSDGSTMSWSRVDTTVIATEEAGLRFIIAAPPGAPRLEPYMGMKAHAAVVRDDGRVFVHLHPLGTISVAAQARLAGGNVEVHDMPVEGDAPRYVAPRRVADTVSFPYAFPEPGRYYIWVQVKRAGKVLTGVFETTVRAPS